MNMYSSTSGIIQQLDYNYLFFYRNGPMSIFIHLRLTLFNVYAMLGIISYVYE